MQQETVKKIGILLAAGFAGGIAGYFAGKLIAERVLAERDSMDPIEVEEPDANQPEFDFSKAWKPEEDGENGKVVVKLEPPVKIDYGKYAATSAPVDPTVKASLEDLASRYKTSIDIDRPVENKAKEPESDLGVIYIITLDQYCAPGKNHEGTTLTYYEDDKQLVNSNEELIAAPEDIIGPLALQHFGSGSEDPDIVYVRNDKNATDYEIVRIHDSYAHAVLGEEKKKKTSNRKVKKNDDSTAEEGK